MNVARVILALVFCTFFTASYFTNKYVLSILKFTFPTIFQGWQTSTGALLLLVTWKLGWVEINGFSRSAAFSQLPGCFLFIGNIYAGSRALSLLPIPFFFVFQNVSEVFAFLIRTAAHRECVYVVGICQQPYAIQSPVWSQWLHMGIHPSVVCR
uniref:Transmembrane protein 241 n=1 Tax=Cyprinus carpio carpio TaxID=630221 RepID=A0A9J8A7L4_CYPCA